MWIASSLARLVGRTLHADALGSVPISYLPTGGLINSLDARVDDPSACCRVRLPDDLPFARLVGEAVAHPKLHREDLGAGRYLRFTLPLRTRFGHSDQVFPWCPL